MVGARYWLRAASLQSGGAGTLRRSLMVVRSDSRVAMDTTIGREDDENNPYHG